MFSNFKKEFNSAIAEVAEVIPRIRSLLLLSMSVGATIIIGGVLLMAGLEVVAYGMLAIAASIWLIILVPISIRAFVTRHKVEHKC